MSGLISATAHCPSRFMPRLLPCTSSSLLLACCLFPCLRAGGNGMALTLEQYATYLDTARPALAGTAEVDRPRPGRTWSLPEVRAVTVERLRHAAGHPGRRPALRASAKVRHEHGPGQDDPGVQDVGLDVAQARPAVRYMRQIYDNVLIEQRLVPGGGREVPGDLRRTDLGSASSRSCCRRTTSSTPAFSARSTSSAARSPISSTPACKGRPAYPGAAAALRHVARSRPEARSDCRRPVFHARSVAARPGRRRRRPSASMRCSTKDLRVPVVRARRPQAVGAAVSGTPGRPLEQQGLAPAQVLHVGSRLMRDLAPAQELGMRTALFAGDKASLQATPEQLKEPRTRPDVAADGAEPDRRGRGSENTGRRPANEASEQESAMPPELHFDPSQLDLSRVLAGPRGDRAGQSAALRDGAARRHRPSRPGAALHRRLQGRVGPTSSGCAATCRLSAVARRADVRGGGPAVLVLHLTTRARSQGDFLGFGGMENVRFRGQVRPGDRLVLVGKGCKFHRRQIIFNVQGFVGRPMVFHADIIGVPLVRRPGAATVRRSPERASRPPSASGRTRSLSVGGASSCSR